MAFRKLSLSCAALLAFASTPIRLGAQSCTFTTIDHPNSFANAATGITKHGLIAGEYLDRNSSRNRGYLFEDGEFTDVDVPGARETQVRGINNHGTIVGTYLASDYSVHAFVLDGDELTTIDFPDAGQTYGAGINGRGEVVGFTNQGQGYLWRDGEFTIIDFPGARSTTPGVLTTMGRSSARTTNNPVALPMAFSCRMEVTPRSMFPTEPIQQRLELTIEETSWAGTSATSTESSATATSTPRVSSSPSMSQIHYFLRFHSASTIAGKLSAPTFQQIERIMDS